MAGKVSDLPGKRVATFVYRDGSGRYTTLFLLPEAGVEIPAEGRIPIERFTPYHRVVSGRQLLFWKQGRLAYLPLRDAELLRARLLALAHGSAENTPAPPEDVVLLREIRDSLKK